MSLSAIVILLYGGMIYGIFPEAVESNVSWESHLMGGIVGFILAFLFRKSDIDFEDKTAKNNNDKLDSPINHTGLNDDIDITYIYKPTDKNIS